MAKPAEEPKLTPGVAFHLQPDGQWSAENLPHKVLTEAKFSGYLTIDGYRCSVFETPDGSMWAQKSVNTPATASAFGRASRSMDSVASRVADAWLTAQHKCSSCRDFAFHGPEQAPVEHAGGMHHPSCPSIVAARADDLVSQVNDILHGKANGPFGHDDMEFDEEILEYCEAVRKALPDMEEIFDTAFHGAMDFKMKLPEAENPRVRQLAQEKIAEMLNQAAARVEIISHGLKMEVEALCQSLEAGARVEQEEEEPAPPPAPKEPAEEPEAEEEEQEEQEQEEEEQGQSQQASSPHGIAQELLAIAAALENSVNPDPDLVAFDLQQILSQLG